MFAASNSLDNGAAKRMLTDVLASLVIAHAAIEGKGIDHRASRDEQGCTACALSQPPAKDAERAVVIFAA